MPNTSIDYQAFKENAIQGRYVTNAQVLSFLEKLPADFIRETIGYSVEGRPIESVTWGKGKTKVLSWSQMHGNESTTTKALFDIINLLQSQSAILNVLRQCTLKIIFILNPDGAEVYTRVNANSIDLNRDAQKRSQPESKTLRKTYDEFKPDFCLNLHGQRTIFNVGFTSRPATVSFLAPAHNVERNISPSRELSMKLIVAINQVLQELIPGQVGRYDDAFNENCVGDAFQMLNTPTVLFEAGHYPGDYHRERTREFIFYALLTAFKTLALGEVSNFSSKDYFAIPENNKLFFDVLIKNVQAVDKSIEKVRDIGILFVETLCNDHIDFVPKVAEIGNLKGFHGHKTYDCMIDEELNELKKQPYWDSVKG
ncbi:M14 metallopeptidase family protein [uncultured Kriegella sp.]|uniref:M14 family metallopeptidase n=1 Tax=uncultured Kriegella sp. TaxID=1798910 RepID=UPI0030D978BF|tara:strand:+ start:173058 stop:174164 length:1107 start_codon:yes stop_codon:yes gene_type:complete